MTKHQIIHIVDADEVMQAVRTEISRLEARITATVRAANNPDILDLSKAARIAGMDVRTLKKHLDNTDQNGMRYTKDGRRKVVNKGDLVEWMSKR